MVFLVSAKNEEDNIRTEGSRMFTTLYIGFDTQWQLTPQSVLGFDRISNSFDIVSAMNDEDPIKNEGARVLTTLNDIFSNTQGQLTPQSLIRSDRNSNLF